MANKALLNLFFFFFLVVLTGSVQSRFITLPTYSSSSADLISDGINNVQQQPSLILLNHRSFSAAEETCEQTYGFLPCTTSVLGNLFLIIVYGSLMFLAARYLSTGSELLLEILGPGIVGGLFLPMLGALPDAMLILVSGLSGSKEIAQSQVLVGMGLLAGSTVMLLTLLWGSCVVLGKCDLDDSTAIDLQDTKRFSLFGSGVTVDIWTKYASWIMLISVIPFIIVQLPHIFHTSSGRRLAVLVSLIVAVALLISYCLYQVFQPWIQRRKLAYAKHKHVMSGILRHLDMHERLLTDDYLPNDEAIKKLFMTIDLDGDACLSFSELQALIVGIRFEEIEFDQADAVQKVLSDFDTSRDGYIDCNEFVKGISKWLTEARRFHVRDSGPHPIHKFHQLTKKEHDMLTDQSDEAVEGVENSKWISFKAVLLLLLGAAIAAAFADPLVDTVDNFSSATSIPSFFISFIALPLATNSSEAVSALIFASRKKKRTASLTFSEIYGAVTMNNILCLAVFLALVYARQLTWDFSAEVLVILIVCISRFITLPSYSSSLSSSDPISDGIHNAEQSSPSLDNSSFSLWKTCERTYGFMPCTTNVFGILFLIIVYGYLMFLAARYISTGSELLLEIIGPGIVGGLFLPILGALPDAMLIFVSGLFGSKETAQNQVMVGMGVLAGSTVMLLTLLWGSCVVLGKCDLEDSVAIDLKDTKRLSLTGSGVTVDIWTKYAAWIMSISVIPFIILQLPQIFQSSFGGRLAVLISLIVAVALLLSYCLYQVFQPWIQKRKHAYAKHKHVTSGILRHLDMHMLEKLLTDDFGPNIDAIKELFRTIDLDGDTHLSLSELRVLITRIQFEDIIDQEDAVQKLLSYLDTSGDGLVDEKEFVKGISRWISDSKRSFAHVRKPQFRVKFIDEFHQNSYWILFKLLLGAVIGAAFAKPLVDSVYNFSTATSIPPFFISFIALPFATHSHEAVSALILASRKQKRTYSLTFSEIYGAVTMNNILCLAVFLAVVYARHLTWNFSAEVLVIIIVCIAMGLFTSFRTTLPLWTCSVAYLLYPFSLVLVYVLDYIYRWS
ncbi:EF-hand domain [Macleaya cordata]|uniref:EF-hand domain n=1 Tax=Macleaya cordata TaxID=56857 RepID=A0A200QVN0_MACCD|nr:EF-hand domain [Macleaya cordata]